MPPRQSTNEDVEAILTTDLSEQELDLTVDRLYQSGFEGTLSQREGVLRAVFDRRSKDKAIKLIEHTPGLRIAEVGEGKPI